MRFGSCSLLFVDQLQFSLFSNHTGLESLESGLIFTEPLYCYVRISRGVLWGVKLNDVRLLLETEHYQIDSLMGEQFVFHLCFLGG